MRAAIRNLGWFGWIGMLIVAAYVSTRPPETFIVSAAPVHSYTDDMVVTPFNKRVSGWSWELRDMPNPYPTGGNCLAVAQELQSRLVDAGRMAIIIVTDPIPNDGESHALVLYNSKKTGLLDSVIDNGFVTGNFPRKREGLYTGDFGRYIGQIDRCDFKQKNLCYMKKNSTI